MLTRFFDFIREVVSGDTRANSKREQALDIIEAHGFKAHMYFAAVGNRQNTELSSALDTLEGLGYIVTDNAGNLIGKVATVRLGSNAIALQRRATFKIVE